MSNGHHKGDAGQIPLLVFHGINSLGWSLYSSLIEALGSNRTIILVNYDAIKPCTLCLNVIDPFCFNRNIIEILDTNFISKVSVVGHSWGTFLTGWILKRIPDRVSHVTLIDPVALAVYFPDTAYTMFYKPPQSTTDHLLRYFLTNDFTISYNLQHHFEWQNAVVFLDDIPDHVGLVIGISMKDEFVCSAAVEIVDKCIAERIRKVNAAPVRKIIWENYMHAEAIMNQDAIAKIAEMVCKNENDMGSEIDTMK